MSEHPLTNVLEAILLAAGRPLSIAQITELFAESERPTDAEVREAFEDLGRRYDGRGVELVEVASGWRIQVRPVHAEVVSRLWQERPSALLACACSRRSRSSPTGSRSRAARSSRSAA